MDLGGRAETLGEWIGLLCSRCLWPATDSVRTGWLLALDMAGLRLVIAFIGTL